jgi:hypothetical protein
MTDLQLKIRRLAHRVSALKKNGKDFSAPLAELTQLRAQRTIEHAGEKKEKADKKAGKKVEAPANA